jgi:hypothetical protein
MICVVCLINLLPIRDLQISDLTIDTIGILQFYLLIMFESQLKYCGLVILNINIIIVMSYYEVEYLKVLNELI